MANACTGRYLSSSLADIYYSSAIGNKLESPSCVHPALNETLVEYEEWLQTQHYNYLLYIKSVMVSKDRHSCNPNDLNRGEEQFIWKGPKKIIKSNCKI